MIPIRDIYGKECWVNIRFLVLTQEEIINPVNEFGVKQPSVHCWKMTFVDGNSIYISDEQKKILTEPEEISNGKSIK